MPADTEWKKTAAAPDGPMAVSASSLTRTFYNGRITALDSVDIHIPAGQMTALVGPDGAGKTTFIRMICGLLSPSSGSLAVLGMDTKFHAQDIQNRISYMPQRFGLYEDLTIEENLNLYADLHGIPQDIRKKRFARLLDMTDLARFTARPAGKLSGGMKQKLALACTLVRTPDLLLLDEPSVGVDPLSRQELWAIIAQMLKEEQMSVIVSTSYMDEAERCGSVFVLYEGRILAQGSPQELRQLTSGYSHSSGVPEGIRARTFQAWLLDQSKVIMDAVPEGDRVRFVLSPEQGKNIPEHLFCAGGLHLSHDSCSRTESRLEDSFMLLLKQQPAQAPLPQTAAPEHRSWISRLADRFAAVPRQGPVPRPDYQENEKVIEVRDLVRKFGDFTAVASTSFTVQRGEVFGLLGPNGAGKTTTFRMLCGLLPATSGYLCVAGENLRTAAAQARAKVGYVSQKFSLYGSLTVLENLRFFGGVYGIPPLALQQRIREVLKEFDLAGHENDLSGNMPGGFKQRLSMAVGLLHRPEILFLDEPTSGIDPLARRVFWRRITALSAEGTTVVITTHFMEEAEYCDRMLIQDAGRMLALGTPAEVRSLAGNAGTMEEAFIRIVEYSRAASGNKV